MTLYFGRERAVDRLLKWAVGMTALSAAGVLLTVAEQRFNRTHLPSPPPPMEEAQIDSTMLGLLRTVTHLPEGERQLIIILDPTMPNALDLIARANSLASSSKPSRRTYQLFVTASSDGRFGGSEVVIATECARQQGKLPQFLQVLAHAAPLADFAALGVQARFSNIDDFVQCIRRRDTARQAGYASLIVNRLRVWQLPSYLLDSQIIRGKMSSDSLASRVSIRS